MREFIVEADGGSRGNPGPAGYGSVVIDAATGETLMERAEYIGVATNNVAEYRGLLAGLRAAHELDPAASVHVRMDSKLVVEQMSGRWKIKHPDMKPLAMEAGRVYPADQVTYEWIPRESNKHADRLANEAMDAGKRGSSGRRRIRRRNWTRPLPRPAAERWSLWAAEPLRPGRVWWPGRRGMRSPGRRRCVRRWVLLLPGVPGPPRLCRPPLLPRAAERWRSRAAEPLRPMPMCVPRRWSPAPGGRRPTWGRPRPLCCCGTGRRR